VRSRFDSAATSSRRQPRCGVRPRKGRLARDFGWLIADARPNLVKGYLNQAGMKVDWMPLQNKDIHGNGHMVMIGKNNLAIAKVTDD
jgi:hypothetical protein